MNEFEQGDIVTHPSTGLIALRVVSPPDKNNYEFVVVDYQNGMECVAIQDKPSRFSLRSKNS